MNTHPNLPHEFHTLSQQNTRLNQNLITVTLNHEHLLEQNHKISQELKKKGYALIESTLREKNLDHSLKNIKSQYFKLQHEYKELHNWMRVEKKLEMRDFFKKESQIAHNMADIQRESYRESTKARNQQLNLYQNRIIDLLKENDSLKIKILEMTAEYSTKIYQLKSANLSNEAKIKALKDFQTKSQQNQSFPSSSGNDLQTLQLQLKIENLKEKLDFYSRENSEIKARNLELNGEIDKLLAELKEAQQNTREESPVNDGLRFQKCSVDFITGVLEQNIKLRKEIEETTNKYILLSETYPKLIEEFETIRELQENIEKFSQVKSTQQKLFQTQRKCVFLQQSLTKLETKYISQLKTRQTLEYKTSILTKRFNQIFIKMNPYFDIYQYESLELDQTMWQFFDQKKDYKSLKEYESKVAGLNRGLKEAEIVFEGKERHLKTQLEERQRELQRANMQREEAEQRLTQLTESNNLLKEQLQNYQISQKIEEKVRNRQETNQKKLQNEVTIPLLQSLISSLQLQRQELFKVIYQRDTTIASLTQELLTAKLYQPIKTINLNTSEQISSSQLAKSSIQFNELIQKNLEIEKKYDQTVEKLSQELNFLKEKLNQQHDIYQVEIKKYQYEYQMKFGQINSIVENWMADSEELRKKMIIEQEKKSEEKRKNAVNKEGGDKEQQAQVVNRGQNLMTEENMQPYLQQQPSNIQNIFSQTSHTNFQNLPSSFTNQEGSSNKLIGESTVQNLNQTLKKYEQEMTETYTMCAKLSEEYEELKKKLKQQEEMERMSLQLRHECHSLREELKQTKMMLNQKNQSLSSLQQLIQTKSTEYDELKRNTSNKSSFLESKLAAQKSLTQKLSSQLQQIKQKFYQLSTAPQLSSQQLSTLSNNEFQTIFVMQSSKHNEISQLSEKNKLLEGKVHLLMQELTDMKRKEIQNKNQEFSPLERQEFKQLNILLQGTNVLQLIKKANTIIEAQKEKEAKAVQQNQQPSQQHQQHPMEEQREEGEHIEI